VEVERKERELLTIARLDRATRESRRGNKFSREFFRESALPSAGSFNGMERRFDLMNRASSPSIRCVSSTLIHLFLSLVTLWRHG
jgi:hypothetical protein